MKKEPPYKHYTEASLLSPQHPVTIALIGCGGTGSQMLNNLARIHKALTSLGHPGFHITVFDSDIVTEANLGRQLFAPSELGMNKGIALLTRINRFYGLRWQSEPTLFDIKKNKITYNIIITAVDNVKIRAEIAKEFSSKQTNAYRSETKNYYWMDLGNTKSCGQIVLSTRNKIEQPCKTKNTIDYLPNIIELHPDLKKHEDKDNTPSCSLAEALEKQDLFINSLLAQYASNIIWKMFREASIKYHGLYLNLETLSTSPISVNNYKN